MDISNFRSLADAYGIAVRAGALTPQRDDEDFFRKEVKLPTTSKDVKSAWDDDGGVRRPITLQTKEDQALEPADPDQPIEE